jgi:hypothetical protein
MIRRVPALIIVGIAVNIFSFNLGASNYFAQLESMLSLYCRSMAGQLKDTEQFPV